MFSTTIKRSVATLGVVAGLLAAAGPASAQILDGPVLAKADRGEVIGLEPTVKAPANPTSAEVSGKEMTNAVKAPTQTWTAGDWIPQPDTEARTRGRMHLEDVSLGIKGDAQDTQASLGRENSIEMATGRVMLENVQITSVKAPQPSENVPAEDRAKYYFENSWPSKVEISGLNDIEAIDFNAPGGTQVGSEGGKYQPPGPKSWMWEIDG